MIHILQNLVNTISMRKEEFVYLDFEKSAKQKKSQR